MKTKKILIDIGYADYGQQKVIKVPLNFSTSQQICMTLILLKEKLIDSIEFKFNNFLIFLKYEKSQFSKYSNFNSEHKSFNGAISKNHIEHVIFFLLKYFRDNIGEAEHIDIDFESPNKEEVTIMFICKDFKVYSPEEIKKMLDI